MAHGMLEGQVKEGKHEKAVSPELFLRVNEIVTSNPHYGISHNHDNEILP